MNATEAASAGDGETVPCSLPEFLLYFLRLGTFGFGGAIALAGSMHRDLVEKRRWVSQKDYLNGLVVAQLGPGSLSAQLAIYLGWVRAGWLGAALTSVSFILPSFTIVLGLAALYLHEGGFRAMRGALYGVNAAVIAIIVRGALHLLRSALRGDRLLWALCLASAVVTAWAGTEIVWLFVLCGIVVAVARDRLQGLGGAPAALWWAPLATGAHGAASARALGTIAAFFAKVGAVAFGGGFAMIPLLYGGAVSRFHWLTERQFLDAVSVGMVTPGPGVITVAFIGYVAAGPLGATVATVSAFLPCFVIVLFAAAFFRRISGSPRARAFLDGVTAAAAGALAGAALLLGKHAIVDAPSALLAAGALAALLRWRRMPEPLLLLAAGAAGLAIKGLGGP